MARTKITDLPREDELSEENLDQVAGGALRLNLGAAGTQGLAPQGPSTSVSWRSSSIHGFYDQIARIGVMMG
jgi:hypothetical protein